MSRKSSLFDTTFDVSILLKGIDGLLELIGGIVLFFIRPEFINQAIVVITQHELSQDPKDYFANHLLKITTHTASAQVFGAVYLVTHGIVKIVLVWGLIKKYLWAYPVSIVFLVLSILYQSYRFYYTHSIGLFLLSLFDMFIVWLVWREYRILQQTKE